MTRLEQRGVAAFAFMAGANRSGATHRMAKSGLRRVISLRRFGWLDSVPQRLTSGTLCVSPIPSEPSRRDCLTGLVIGRVVSSNSVNDALTGSRVIHT
jgi:hypothetical protein